MYQDYKIYDFCLGSLFKVGAFKDMHFFKVLPLHIIILSPFEVWSGGQLITVRLPLVAQIYKKVNHWVDRTNQMTAYYDR